MNYVRDSGRADKAGKRVQIAHSRAVVREQGRSSGTREWMFEDYPTSLFMSHDRRPPVLVILGVFHGTQDERKI
jgi:hypothetical protein